MSPKEHPEVVSGWPPLPPNVPSRHVTCPPPLVRVRAVSREAVSGGTTLILITITTYQPST